MSKLHHNNFKTCSSALAVLCNKKEKHYIFEDKVPAIIGRNPTAFLCIEETYISRKHCIIEKTEDNKFTICDLSSSGTYVNDKRLVKNRIQELNNLDKIKLADNDAHSYVFLVNKRRFGLMTPPRMKTGSPLATKMVDLNETQNLEQENLDKELNIVGSEKFRLKEALQNELKAREDELERERLKLEEESAYNKEQAKKLEVKLKETMEEKERVMNEYECKIADNTKKEEELQKVKSEMIKRHQIEREELESKCKAEIEELKKKLEKSEAQSQQVEELQRKLEEVKSALLESEMEQQRLFEAKVEVETKLETKISDLTNDAQKVKELEIKLKEKECLEERVKREMEGLEDDIMCGICAELYIEPTALNCGHMFCKMCITLWSKKKKICPMCRAKILNTVRIYNMDSVIQRNIRLMSEEAQSRHEALIAERKQGNTPQKRTSAKKRRREDPPEPLRQPLPEPRPAPALRIRATNDLTPVADQTRRARPESQGDDPFAVGWVGRRGVIRPAERASPITVAAVDLTNIPMIQLPGPAWPRQPPPHTVTSSADTTIDLTDL